MKKNSKDYDKYSGLEYINKWSKMLEPSVREAQGRYAPSRTGATLAYVLGANCLAPSAYGHSWRQLRSGAGVSRPPAGLLSIKRAASPQSAASQSEGKKRCRHSCARSTRSIGSLSEALCDRIPRHATGLDM